MVTPLLPLTIDGAIVRKRSKILLGPLDLTITQHGIHVVIGANGSGKTTLLRLIHGLEHPREGSVRWGTEPGDAATQQAFVFQHPILLRRSVLANAAYPLLLRGMKRGQAYERARMQLAEFGLEGTDKQDARTLSGGEQQKLALARALINEPELVLLDEPTTNLGGVSIREIEEHLKRSAAAGASLIMATHDMGQARRLADQIIYLHEGKMQYQGPASVFFDNPPTRQAEAYLKGEIVE